MLGRSNRFHGYNSVLPVYRSAEVVRVNGCSLHFKQNPRRRSYRLAVVISKKVAKSAVVRNRIRRRVYESVRLLNINTPVDLIITVYDAELADIPAPKLQKLLINLFKKGSLRPR